MRRRSSHPNSERTHQNILHRQAQPQRLKQKHHTRNRNLIIRRQTSRRRRSHQRAPRTLRQAPPIRNTPRKQRTQLTRGNLLTHRRARTHRHNLHQRMNTLPHKPRAALSQRLRPHHRLHRSQRPATPPPRLQHIPGNSNTKTHHNQRHHAPRSRRIIRNNRVQRLIMAERHNLNNPQHPMQHNSPAPRGHTNQHNPRQKNRITPKCSHHSLAAAPHNHVVHKRPQVPAHHSAQQPAGWGNPRPHSPAHSTSCAQASSDAHGVDSGRKPKNHVHAGSLPPFYSRASPPPLPSRAQVAHNSRAVC